MTDWKLAMLCLLPLMWGGAKPRTWAAVIGASLMAMVSPYEPASYLAIDLFCGGLVLAKPAGLSQKTIGILFAIMAVIDTGYLLSPRADNGITYYYILSTIGWVQFAVLAAWGAHDAGTTLARRFGNNRHKVAHRTGLR